MITPERFETLHSSDSFGAGASEYVVAPLPSLDAYPKHEEPCVSFVPNTELASLATLFGLLGIPYRYSGVFHYGDEGITPEEARYAFGILEHFDAHNIHGTSPFILLSPYDQETVERIVFDLFFGDWWAQHEFCRGEEFWELYGGDLNIMYPRNARKVVLGGEEWKERLRDPRFLREEYERCVDERGRKLEEFGVVPDGAAGDLA